MKRRTAIAASIACLSTWRRAWAQQPYPAQTIRIVVPFSAGGVADLVHRLIAERLAKLYGVPVIIDNRAGAGGAIGTELVAKSAPDGYTLLATSFGFTVSPSVMKNVSWSPVRDFQAVACVGAAPNFFVVPAKAPAKTMEQFVSFAKAASPPATYGSAGIGTSNHLAGELLAQRTGVNLVHVPYKGQSEAMNDLLGERLSCMALTAALAAPHVESGKLRVLAITGAKRSTLFPDIPTIAETLRIPDFDVSSWQGLSAPAGVPKSIVDKLSADVCTLLKDPAVTAKLEAMGMSVWALDSAAFQTLVAAEYGRWSAVIAKAGIKPE